MMRYENEFHRNAIRYVYTRILTGMSAKAKKDSLSNLSTMQKGPMTRT